MGVVLLAWWKVLFQNGIQDSRRAEQALRHDKWLVFAQGGDAVAFYTRKKVITQRWFGAEVPKDGWV